MNIYVPDNLATEVRDELGDANVSGICQDALKAELKRARTRAKIGAEGFERVEVYDSQYGNGRDVAFQGREIGYASYLDQTAYLTPKGSIAVYSRKREELSVYGDFEDFAAGGHPDRLVGSVAVALGEKWIAELDI